MKTLNLIQGSPEWAEHRGRTWNASDAPAMMGVKPEETRSALLRRLFTGAEPEGGYQRARDDGHRFEELARPLAEGIIGDELYPLVGVSETPHHCFGGRYLGASFDGITMLNNMIFEHKSLNDDLRAVPLSSDGTMEAARLPLRYRIQMMQQMMVSGAESVLFMATKWDANNQLVEARRCFYYAETDPDLAQQIVDGWRQFAIDLSTYVHTAVPDQVVAKEQPALPVVIVKTEGQIAIRDNLPEFGVALKAYIAALPAKPSTDQEFADADAACRTLKKAEDALAGEEDRALASMTSVEALRTTIANLRAIARQARLATEKLVDKRKIEIRAEIATEFRAKLAEHVKGLNANLCAGLLVFLDADWGSAMKAKRTVQGLRDGCDDLLTKAKLTANDKAAAIRANLDTIDAAARPHLFADRAQLVLKDHEAVATIVVGRVQAEDERLERERQAAEQRERERIEREAKEAADKALRAAQAVTPAPVVEQAALQRVAPAAPLVTGSGVSTAVRTAPATPPTLRLGAICERLGFIINAALVDQLGIEPAARDTRNLPLFHEHQFSGICQALILHIAAAMEETAPA